MVAVPRPAAPRSVADAGARPREAASVRVAAGAVAAVAAAVTRADPVVAAAVGRPAGSG
ncbi:hypothetical protein [Streptomyces purpureus]|uniref:Uncharacterized protein n=1 Tax=Streptomyces purpureus TaxID=1951 RepID=A0A918H077_9ACTN|nr:hypothetical protein [Streptomyces purpureus]GGT21361.1 hypothetical protein GCM10014713_12870 [Streptomyces purpureus]